MDAALLLQRAFGTDRTPPHTPEQRDRDDRSAYGRVGSARTGPPCPAAGDPCGSTCARTGVASSTRGATTDSAATLQPALAARARQRTGRGRNARRASRHTGSTPSSRARRGLKPLAPAPPPRRDDLAPPHAAPRGLRRPLVRDVVRRVLPVRERPSLLDHPGVHVAAGDAAPHRHVLPPARQVCFDSGASMPCRRTRSAPNLSVSPSVTVAAPDTWAQPGPAATRKTRRRAAARAMNDSSGQGRRPGGASPREA